MIAGFRTTLSICCQVLLLSLAGFGAPSAWAGEARIVEEILVTATKRASAIQDVAGSISALGLAEIEERDIRNVEDLQGMIPNLNFRDHLGARLITIRGIGGNIETGVVEPGVAAHLDGIYLPRADMLAVNFADLERVEVLRGPQGTLYGRNATGGTINFITQAPTREFEARVSAGAGSHGAVRTSAMISGPLSEAVAGRLTGFYDDSDGYIDNVWTGNDIGGGDRHGVRGALAVDLGAGWTADVSIGYQEADLAGPAQVDYALETAVFPAVITGVFGATVTNTDRWHEVVQAEDPRTEIETTIATLKVSRSLADDLQFTSLTGYIDHTYGPQLYGFAGVVSDGLLTPGLEFQFGTIGRPGAERMQESETFTQEFNLSGSAFESRLEWLLGLYYFRETFDAGIPFEFVDPNVKALVGGSFTVADPVLFPPGTMFFGRDQAISEENTNAAAFVDATWSITDAWRVNLGARYAQDEKDVEQFLETLLILPPGSPLAPDGGAFTLPECPTANSIKLDDNEFSPKLRLEWDASDSQLLYAQWQQGTKSGQVNLALCNDIVEPEEITAYELGYKSTFAEGRGIFNVAAFFYQYDEFQTMEFTTDGTAAFLTNVPSAELLGVELEGSFVVNDALALDASLTWLDSEITKDSPEIGFDTANPAAGVQNVEGNPLPSTPKYTAQAAVNYEFAVGRSAVKTRVQYAWFDEQSFRLFGVQEVHPEDGQDAYGLLDVFATVGFTDDRYQVRGFLRNALDEEYKYWSLYSLATGFSGTAAPPRTWGVELFVNF